jgi:bifunctional non-homologous end joining protein LigD
VRPPRFDTAQLSLVRVPFDHPDFLFELKHDGFRALAHIWDGNSELVSRKRNAYKSFQELKENLAKLKVQNAVIDGEIVCLDEEGRSIFNELLFRRGCPTFYAFDLLYLNGRDLRKLPLVERKEKLRAILDKSELPDVICGKYIEGRGVDLFNEVCERNLEGVVAKRKTGTYSTISGWLKIKNPNYTQSERRHELFESFKTKSTNSQRSLPPIPKKPPRRAIIVPKKVDDKSPARAGRSRLRG